MSNEIETPPSQGGSGCIGKGCTTFFGLVIFFVIALIAGTFWGIHYLRGFSSPEPLSLPVVESTPSAMQTPAPLAMSPASTPAGVVAVTPEPAAAVTPGPTITPAARTIRTVYDWKTFQQAAKRGEAVRVELSDADINGLIAASKEARGMVFVSIHNDVGRVQLSLPLDGVPMMSGRYLNGELIVEPPPDGDPAKIRVSKILVNGEEVSNAFLDRSLFGYPSLRTVVGKWLTKERIGAVGIENNRVFGESTGSR